MARGSHPSWEKPCASPGLESPGSQPQLCASHQLTALRAPRYRGLSAQPGAKDLSATGPDCIKIMFKEVKPENSL